MEAAERIGQPHWKILVVDDECAVREGIAKALRRADGFAVETAAGWFEAGLLLDKFAPDLVILDLVMPGMGGLEVCRRIRRARASSETKIIVLTGFPGDRNREGALFSDADLFLSKPQSAVSLRTHVRDLLEA